MTRESDGFYDEVIKINSNIYVPDNNMRAFNIGNKMFAQCTRYLTTNE